MLLGNDSTVTIQKRNPRNLRLTKWKVDISSDPNTKRNFTGTPEHLRNTKIHRTTSRLYFTNTRVINVQET